MAIKFSPIEIFLNLLFLELDTSYIVFQQVRRVLGPADSTKYRFLNAKSNKKAILLPGIFEPWQIMKPVADMLVSEGYHVHVLPELGYNTNSVTETANIVEKYIHDHELKKVAIVSHSKGGLVAKTLLLSREMRKRIGVAVCINTPFMGSHYSRFLPLKSLAEFNAKSEVITGLTANTKANSKIVCLYSAFDPQIINGGRLDGATNIQLSVRGHYLPLQDKKAHNEIKKQLKSVFN